MQRRVRPQRLSSTVAMLTLLSACQCGEPTTPQDAATRDALLLEDAAGASDAWQRADIGLSRPDVPTIEEPCRSQSRILPTTTLPSDWATDSVSVVGYGDSLLLVLRTEATLLDVDALGESLPGRRMACACSLRSNV